MEKMWSIWTQSYSISQRRTKINHLIWAFLFGAMSMLILHQGALCFFEKNKIVSDYPWNMTLVNLFNIPKVLSLAFWGGIWGLPAFYWSNYLKKFMPSIYFWPGLIFFGAIFPTTFTMLVIFLLKGNIVTPKMIVLGFILNGLWGAGDAIGLYFLQKTFQRKRKMF